MAVYVCSDIHGQHGLFLAALKKVSFSGEDRLLIIGDLIDRGPGSIPLLQDVMRMENVVCLLGNHENMMLDYYHSDPEERWSLPWTASCNGGTMTKRGFEALPEEEQERILAFLGEMYLQVEVSINEQRFLLSHSDFLPKRASCLWKEIEADEVSRLVWNSPWRTWEYVPESKYNLDGRMHVIGHYPVQRIPENPDPAKAYIDREHNLINIDLGCAGLSVADRHQEDRGLCLLNLTAWAAGDEEGAFTYTRPEI